MKKQKLNLDALEVDTFELLPDADAAAKGTVMAHGTDHYAECGTYNSGCCGSELACTGDPGCGGIGSQQCISAGYDCTWYPVLMCMTNPIAYPTEPRCDDNCGLTSTC